MNFTNCLTASNTCKSMPFYCLTVCFSYILLHFWCIPSNQIKICFNLFSISRCFFVDSKFNYKTSVMKYFLYAEVSRNNWEILPEVFQLTLATKEHL